MIILFVVFYLLVALGYILEVREIDERENTKEGIGFTILGGLLWPCLIGAWLLNQTRW